MKDDHELSLHDAEVLRRAAASWRNDKPTPFALRRAFRAWGSHGRRGPARLSLAAAALLTASSLVTGGALGISGIVRWPATSQHTTSPPPPASIASVGSRPAKPKLAAPAAPLADTSSAAPPSPALPTAARVESLEPPVARRPSSFIQNSEPPAFPTDPWAGSSTTPKLTGAWSRAAQALRVRDEAEAIRALEELAQSPEATTRDAALLARAQLEVRQGRLAQAAPILRELASSGATPLIRRRAGEVLSGAASSPKTE
jgi:hypothetical protein